MIMEIICHVTSRDDVYKVSCDFMKPLAISHHPVKFGVHMHCDRGDIRSLIWQVTIRYYECVRLTKWPQYIFSVSLKFGVCYITGQLGEFRVKNAIICFHTFFWYFFVLFFSS